MAAEPSDLILLDVRMRGIDGLEVCRRLKAREDTRHIPVILISALAEAAEWVVGIQMGAADYITKPFHAEELLTRVKTHLALSRATLGAVEDRRHSGEALARSEKRYRRLFESAKDGILILDGDTGRVVDVNPFLVDLLGYSSEEFLGKEVWELGPLKNAFSSWAAFRELQATGYVRHEDLPLETRDGRRIAVEFVCNAYLVDESRVIQCNIRDISDRRRMETKLHETEEQLRQSQKMEAIGGIAHDFNNMLGAIIGYSDVMVLGLHKDDPICGDVEQIKVAAYRAAALTRQLLAFSRKQVLQPRVFNLNSVVTDIEKLLKRLIGDDVGACARAGSSVRSARRSARWT